MSQSKPRKRKLNLTIRPESRLKLEQIAEVESRSVSNLVEVMADERYQRLQKACGR